MEMYDGWPFPREGKWCNRCKQTKLFAEFGRNRTNRDGLQNYCKKCNCTIAHEAYVKNPQAHLEASKRSRMANLEEYQAKNRERKKRARASLSDSYVRKQLTASGTPVAPTSWR